MENADLAENPAAASREFLVEQRLLKTTRTVGERAEDMILNRHGTQRGVRERLGSGLPLVCWPRPPLGSSILYIQRFRSSVRLVWPPIKAVLNFLWSPLTLVRLYKIPVQVHSTFLIYPVGFFTWDLCADDTSRGLLRALVVLLVFSGSLLVHEFAHVLTARYWGIGTRRVIMIPLGAVAQLESRPGVPSELWIALAGPLASLALAGVFWLALHTMPSPVWYWLMGRDLAP